MTNWGDWHTPDMLSLAEAEHHFDAYDRPLDVVPTPFEMLNQACRGFGGRKGPALGWYIVLGGDTGQGKSLLALQLAVEANRHGRRVGFVSLEMSMHEIRSRFYSQMFGVEARELEPGAHFQPATRKRVLRKLEEYRSKGYQPFYAMDDLHADVLEVTLAMDRWRDDAGVDVFVVDYLQLCEDRTAVGQAQEIQRISKAMRDYAHKHRVLVIGLSQYNNEGGNDRARSPHVGHLYGGRRISQDSDITILLDHSRYAADPFEKHLSRTYLLVAKNRHGPKGFDVPLEWDYRTLTAREARPDELHAWPEREKAAR